MLLLIAKFVINSAIALATKVIPFYANYGYQLVIYKKLKLTFAVSQAASLEINKLKGLHLQLQANIKFLNKRLAKYTNKHRSQEPSQKERDKVYLLQKNIKTKQLSSKLDYKMLRLYKIKKKVLNVNYKLELLKGFRVHLIFHVLLLKEAARTTKLSTNKIKLEHKLDVYNVKRVLNSKISKKGQIEYLIKQLDQDNIHNTQEPKGNLSCPKKLIEFYQQNPSQPKPLEEAIRS